jgi:hypothetical protein
MLVLLMLPQLRPLGTTSLNVTVPVNPFSELTVTVMGAVWPEFTGDGVLEEKEKSGAGGLGGTKVSRHPHPMGLLLHCIAP